LTLKLAREETEGVRDEFKVAVATVLEMRSKIEGMSAQVELNSTKEMERLANELSDAEFALSKMPSCKWW
jgi:hypothetical protein